MKEDKPVIHFESMDEFCASKFSNISDPEAQNWKTHGKPKMWVLAQREGDVSFWNDLGYGGIKLVVGNLTAELGNEHKVVVNGDYIGIDAEFYRVRSYIYKRIS